MKMLRNTLGILASISMIVTMGLAIDNNHFEGLKTFKGIKGKVTGNTLIGKDLDMYLVKGVDGQGRPFEVVTDKNGDFLILSSKVFNTKKQEPITVPMNVEGLKGKEALTFGNGNRELYVFTDPECRFCKDFKKIWPKIKNDVKMHVFFFNLDFHKEADGMTRWALDATSDEEKAERLIAISNGSIEYKKAKLSNENIEKYNKIIKEHKELGKKIGIQGTPTVTDMDGKIVAWPDLGKGK